MGLVVKPLKEFQCPHCSGPLESGNAGSLEQILCVHCNREVYVPVQAHDIILLARIGRHPAGEIFFGQEKYTGRKVRVIITENSNEKLKPIMESWFRTLRQLANISHDGLVRIYRIASWEEHVVVILEAHDPTLNDISAETTWSEGALKRFGWKIADALEAAQRVGVIHMSLHPRDILLRGRGLRVSGFSPWNFLENAPKDSWIRLYKEPFIPPEVRFHNHKPNFISDVWSLGALLFWLITHRIMTPEDDVVAVLKAVRPEMSSMFRNHLAKMVHTDPAQRFSTWQEVKNILSEQTAHIKIEDSEPTSQQESVQTILYQDSSYEKDVGSSQQRKEVTEDSQESSVGHLIDEAEALSHRQHTTAARPDLSRDLSPADRSSAVLDTRTGFIEALGVALEEHDVLEEMGSEQSVPECSLSVANLKNLEEIEGAEKSDELFNSSDDYYDSDPEEDPYEGSGF